MVIKANYEIEGIKDCCRIVAEVLAAIGSFVKPGITTMELELIADSVIKKNKAVSAFRGYTISGLPPFPSSICTSVNSCIVHGIPRKETILKDGDIIGVDVGVAKNGFFGDGAKTFAVGEISKKATDLMKATEEALNNGIGQAKAGRKVGDISYAIGSYIKSKGYYVADYLTGHGIGRSLHEEPVIPNSGTKGKGSKLYAGMTLAIEPMVNIGTNRVREEGWEYFVADDSLSAHFEHTILVTEEEPIILTKC